jgi:hypothetical protein
MVSGLTIATTSRTDGNQRQSQTNRKRSVLLRCSRFGVRRRSTLTCCRKTRFSASSVALALKREARIPRNSLNRSVIRMRAYAVRLLRLRRIEFSVQTAAEVLELEVWRLDSLSFGFWRQPPYTRPVRIRSLGSSCARSALFLRLVVHGWPLLAQSSRPPKWQRRVCLAVIRRAPEMRSCNSCALHRLLNSD